MPHPEQEPTFLPLTVAIAKSSADPTDSALSDPVGRQSLHAVRQRAEEANTTAAGCWAALLGGCESPERRAMPTRLRALAEATSLYVGTRWWCGHGATHRRRVAEAQLRINDAVREGDGAEFADAFVGYDQAIATAMVSVPSRLENPTP
ncbi:hypothetical protein [Haloactinomyces albus]|uniref:Uncharacterized protein n=1 Tax=Haloactinomyces albus TaxID=1352928 RepID=A0AAE4CP46_9ACTN|nr:hypothetical protein [Haloactinomyces albus]MDR7302742.1 hypothetical protein [Haloactinomyces albus]